MTDTALRLGWTKDPAGFEALSDEWTRLLAETERAHHVFQSPCLLRHWIRHFLEPGDALRILTARRGNRLVAIWPLMLSRRAGIATLGFLGFPIAQYGDVLLARGEDHAALLDACWDAIRNSGADLVRLARVRADSSLLLGPPPTGLRRDGNEQALFADLARRAGADGPGPAYAARERSNYRRRLRRLSEQGDIAFEEVRAGSAAAAVLAAEAVALKRSQLSHHGIVGPAVCDRRFEDFFRAFAADPEAPMSVSAIRRDGIAVAVNLDFDGGDTSFGHVLAVSPGFQREGLGQALIHHSFAHARRRGHAVYDLMPPAQDYKRDHADGVVQVTDITLPLTAKGRLVCALAPWRLRPAAKRLIAALPPRLRMTLARWVNRR